MFSISDARRVQRDFKLTGVHVLWYDPDKGFSLAHTDYERASGMNLADCMIHRWLVEQNPGFIECCFPEAGWYRVDGLHEAEGLVFLSIKSSTRSMRDATPKPTVRSPSLPPRNVTSSRRAVTYSGSTTSSGMTGIPGGAGVHGLPLKSPAGPTSCLSPRK